MIQEPTIDVPLRLDIDERDLLWPGIGHSQIGGSVNMAYEDLTGGSTWETVAYALEKETGTLRRYLEEANSVEDFERALDEMPFADFDWLGELACTVCRDLDFGVVAATLALNAAGCPTIYSCSGTLGHGEGYPYVAFFVRPGSLSILVDAAKRSAIGLVNGIDGCAEICSDRLSGLSTFAAALLEAKGRFAALDPVVVCADDAKAAPLSQNEGNFRFTADAELDEEP